MYKQQLSHYIHDFLSDARWVRRESGHYVFYYFKKSLAEKEIKKIEIRQENAYKKIIGFLKVPGPGKKIEYFLYPDAETKKALMGDDWYAQSIYNEIRIHCVYTEKDKPIGEHEDTHLLSLPWGLSVNFFQEGLAEFMVGHAWDGRLHVQYVREGYGKHFYPSLPVLIEPDSWLNSPDDKAIYFYSLAGAFTAFLVDRFSAASFEAFYKATDRERFPMVDSGVFRTIFGKSLEDIEKDFRESLDEE